MLLIAIPLVVIIAIRRGFYRLMVKWGYTLSKNQINVDENLPNFFEAVKLSDADWMVFENRNLRQNYGFNFIPETVEEQLDDWQLAKKPIQGVAWYNILANPIYARQFNFIEVNVPSREDLIVDGDDNEENDCEQSDMVQVLLNIAFAPRDVVKSYTFGEGLSKTFK